MDVSDRNINKLLIFVLWFLWLKLSSHEIVINGNLEDEKRILGCNINVLILIFNIQLNNLQNNANFPHKEVTKASCDIFSHFIDFFPPQSSPHKYPQQCLDFYFPQCTFLLNIINLFQPEMNMEMIMSKFCITSPIYIIFFTKHFLPNWTFE